MLTVSEVSQVTGITPRTLHYYHEIGLLEPSHVAENGYRYYDQDALLRLQQILLYRELELPLSEIRRILESKGFDLRTALRRHKREIEKKIGRLRRLAATVDETIHHIEGGTAMSESRMFGGFTEKEEKAYSAEAESMYDGETVRESNRRWKSYGTDKQEQIIEEANRIYDDLRELLGEEPDAPTVQACIRRWRDHMEYFWTPSLEQLIGLAEMYNTDDRFKSKLQSLDPKLPAFMLEAVRHYVAAQRESS